MGGDLSVYLIALQEHEPEKDFDKMRHLQIFKSYIEHNRNICKLLRMARRNKRNRPIKPDDYIAFGPIEMARFGKNIVSRSNFSKEQFEEHQKKLHNNYDKVVGEINTLVQEIADAVSILPAAQLLHRAWWEFSSRRIMETDRGDQEEAVALRMIDYVQSIIAATPPKPNVSADLSDEDWQNLKVKVETLFRRINTEYQMCLLAKKRAENADHNDDLEELRFRAELMWCNVRGKRYQNHDVAALSEALLPHTAVIEELFGITSEQMIHEFEKIWHSLTFGLGDAVKALDEFRQETLARIEQKARSDEPETQIEDLFQSVLATDQDLKNRGANAIEKFLGYGLFDVEKITNLPRTLLEELSWEPGQDTDFFAPGEFRGWPQRVWPIFKRPFIKLDNRYYCFDIYSLFDHLYRVIQRIIFRLKPAYQGTWNETQQHISEELPFQYFRKLLPNGREIRPIYYWWHPAAGTARQWIESDGIYIYEDHLFILEIKAGAFTWTSPATDLNAHIQSLQNLVQNPTLQGQRFLKYLQSAPSVPIYDKNHNEIEQIELTKFRHVTVCAVTLDHFNEITAQNQHLKKSRD